jgi:hypothetical protein
MIAEVAKAITSYFKTSNAYSTVDGRLYFHQAPQDVDFPYAVFYFIGASHEEIMSSASINNIIDITLQFNIFDDSQDGGAKIADVAKDFDNAFHWATINVSGYSYVKMQRQAILPVKFIDEIWQVSITYELSIQQS